MPKSIILHYPSLESSAPVGEPVPLRPSLYDAKDNFIERIAPIGMAAMYFGSFSLAPQDVALSRQALFKLSFINRQFLQPAGLRILVQRETAVLSGKLSSRALGLMAEILALQIEGINHVTNQIEAADGPSAKSAKSGKGRDTETIRDAVALLFATDQTLRAEVQVHSREGRVALEGHVASSAQKNWAEQLVEAAGGEVDSKLKIGAVLSDDLANPPQVDDESLQALVLLRLRLIRDTEHLPLRVKANRGIVSLQGKVRTEALRRRAENLTRSTLGLRELRSTLSLAP